MACGRRSFNVTAGMLADNLQSCGSPLDQFSLLVNYDPVYDGTPVESFRVPPSTAQCFREVLYFGPAQSQAYLEALQLAGIPEEVIEVFTLRRGFGQRKNLILLSAASRGYDAVLFWDDDEYPFYARKIDDNDSFVWSRSNIMKDHFGARADVTNGFATGFVLPVPPDLTEILPDETRSLLGRALSTVSDAAVSEAFMFPERNFVTIDRVAAVSEVAPDEYGVKWVSGGNLGVRLDALLDGRIPPFFTPRDSRADDTMFSLGLGQAHVFSVPVGIFHDCFGSFGSDVADGTRSRRWKPSTYAEKRNILNRLSSAMRGWVAYIPILMRAMYGERRQSDIGCVQALLADADVRIQHEWPELYASIGENGLSGVLSNAQKSAPSEFDLWRECSLHWKHLCSAVHENPLRAAAAKPWTL